MIQIFFLGASSIYGVGGEKGGYADIVKQKFHKEMFAKGGIGEKYEIYNFGKSGATVDFVREIFPIQLKNYGRGGKTIAVINVGGNNAKAEGAPTNYVSTIEEYSKQMINLLDMLQAKCSYVIAVGSGFYDETKTNPKPSPLTGRKSYFTNARSRKFQNRLRQICKDKKITFIGLEIEEKKWREKYLYEDGLHANTKGHEFIADKVMAEIKKVI